MTKNLIGTAISRFLNDTVQIYYFTGNNTYVNRSGEQNITLGFTVYDVDKQINSAGVSAMIWVTNDTNQFDGFTVSSNSTGQFFQDFNPKCNYSVGLQWWIGGVTDSCYIDTNYTTNLTTHIIGKLNNTLEDPSGGEYLRGSNITIVVNVTEECGQR